MGLKKLTAFFEEHTDENSAGVSGYRFLLSDSR